jgi:hypothetical protein
LWATCFSYAGVHRGMQQRCCRTIEKIRDIKNKKKVQTRVNFLNQHHHTEVVLDSLSDYVSDAVAKIQPLRKNMKAEVAVTSLTVTWQLYKDRTWYSDLALYTSVLHVLVNHCITGHAYSGECYLHIAIVGISSAIKCSHLKNLHTLNSKQFANVASAHMYMKN